LRFPAIKAIDGFLLVEKRKLNRLGAYGLASVAMGCRIAPLAGAEKTVHCLLPKSLWHHRQARLKPERRGAGQVKSISCTGSIRDVIGGHSTAARRRLPLAVSVSRATSFI
jgi:hypothetical protein